MKMENDEVLTKNRQPRFEPWPLHQPIKSENDDKVHSEENIRTCICSLRHSHFKIQTSVLEIFSANFDTMVNYFTDVDELMSFAATLAIQDSVGVLFQLTISIKESRIWLQVCE
ncbi:hypothetical protein ACF0H5_015081 [Mactra antiquata]